MPTVRVLAEAADPVTEATEDASEPIDLRADVLYSRQEGENGQLHRVFRWLTRNGMGRHFPGMPIGWYQQHQIHAIDVIVERAKAQNLPLDAFRVHKGEVEARGADRKWVRLVSTRTVFDEADRRSRGGAGEAEVAESDMDSCGCRTVKDPPGLTVSQVHAQLAQHGIVLRKKNEYGDFRVNFRGGGEGTAYYTPDLDDALATGLAMARARGAAAPIPTGLHEAGEATIDPTGDYALVQRMLKFFVLDQGLGHYVPNSAVPTGGVSATGSGIWSFYTRSDFGMRRPRREAPIRREVEDAYLRQVYAKRGVSEAGETGEADYNGWTNEETWAVNIAVTQQQPLYQQIIEHPAPFTSKTARAFVERVFPQGLAGFRVGPSSYGKVNWEEIAGHWNEIRRDVRNSSPGLNEAAAGEIISEATEYGVAWQQRRDGVWMARGTGGIYYMMPTPSGMYHTIWMADSGDQQDLGVHSFAAGAQAVARYTPNVSQTRGVSPDERILVRPRAAEASETQELRWERSGGGTGWRGEGRAGTYLLRHVLGKTAGTDDTGWWNLHVSGRQYGPYPSLDAAKQAAAHMDKLAVSEGASEAQDPARRRALELAWHALVQAGVRYTRLMPAESLPGEFRYDAYVDGSDTPVAIVNVHPDRTTVHLAGQRTRHYPSGFASEAAAPDGVAASDAMPVVEAGQVCRPWVRMEKDPQAYNACMKLAEKVGPIEGHERLYEICRQQMEREDVETYYAILFDTHLGLRAMSEIARGARDRVPTPMPDLARVALYQAVHYGAMGLAVAHCHPSGKARPSDADKQVTQAVEEACHAMGLLFVDHLVVGSKQYYSFKKKKIFKVDR
jgi:hypothetical protein